MAEFIFPRLYPILDSTQIPQQGRAEFLARVGEGFAEAGVRLLEYRNKKGGAGEIAADAAVLRRAMPAGQVKLILDDRAELVDRIRFDGVHVDDGDLLPAEARGSIGPEMIIGTFGGSERLIQGILYEPVDYWAIGPVFTTVTKKTEKQPIGIEGVRRLRQEAGPEPVLSAVGGITLPTAEQIFAAGASMVAISGAIFRTPDPVAACREWMRVLG